MFYDLNVPAELATPPYLKRLQELGWNAVAINYVHTGKVPREPCPYSKHHEIGLRQYTRLTLVLNDPQQNVALSGSEVLRSFDIIAVRPTTERTFQIACQSLDVDIISLDLSDKLPYNIKHGLVREAIRRGMIFEISYGPSISAPISNGKRRNVLSSVMHLTRVIGRAKGLLVSSGQTAGEFCLRAPHCIRNWVEMVGVKADCSKSCLVDNPFLAVKHAGDRKWSAYGAVVCITEKHDFDFYADYLRTLQ